MTERHTQGFTGIRGLFPVVAATISCIAGWLLGAPAPGSRQEVRVNSDARTELHSGTASQAPPLATELPQDAQERNSDPPEIMDREDFDRLVKTLAADGLDEKLAQYLALDSAAVSDFSKSFKIAQAAKLLLLWAGGPALRDPERTAEFLVEFNHPGNSSAAGIFLEEMGRTDPDRGKDLIAKLPKSITTPDYSLFKGWGERDPRAAAEAALLWSDGTPRREALIGAMQSWTDSEALFGWASKQEAWVLDAAFSSLYNQYGTPEPDRVLALLRKHAPGRNFGLEVSLGQALAAEGTSGFEKIRSLPPSGFRSTLEWRYANELSKADPETAKQLAASLPPEDRSILFGSSMYYMATADPKGVAEFIASDTDLNPAMRTRFASIWASQDPAASFDWLLANTSGLELGEYVGQGISQWLAVDPAQARQAFEALSPGLQAKALGSFATTWGTNDPESAIAWATGLEPIARMKALDKIAIGWSETDPIAAAEGIEHLPGNDLGDAFRQVASNLAVRDPGYAKDWINRLSDDRAREKAMDGLMGGWARQDAIAASEYLSTLQEGGLRDVAVGGFSNVVRTFDPESAAEWATRIGDEKRRGAALRSVMYSWRNQSRPAAEAYVSRMEDARLREELLKIIRPQ